MRSFGSAASMRVASRISLTLRSIEISLDNSMFLATCWVIVEAPTGRRLARNRLTSVIAAQDRDRVDPVMAVKIFVLGRQKGVDDGLWNGLYRHKDPPLGCVFGEEPPVARLHSGHDRRLIMRKLLVIR